MDTAHFGHWLKHSRKRLDLTQSQLAVQLGCTVATIKKLEADQRRPSRQLAERLMRILQIPPEEQASFIQLARTLPGGVRPAQPGPASSIQPQPLPAPLTPLIDRTHEVSYIRDLLQRKPVRLVSLIGPPGVGKTRVGLQVAADLRDEYSDGVCFVPLAPLRDAGLLLGTVARALGMCEGSKQSLLSTLIEALSGRRLLLFLDNFEHLHSAAPLLTTLLKETLYLQLLVTSQVRLRLSGEHVFALTGLQLPTGGPTSKSEDMKRSPAVTLFAQRAAAVNAHFSITDANVAVVEQICARLDGLPLAIELAAARSHLFTPDAILARLDRPLALLTQGAQDVPANQQTMRAALSWSYNLLAADEQLLLQCLAVFAGGATVSALQAVYAARGHAPPEIDRLGTLLDRSLIQRELGPAGEIRFVMLETIRAFALERLEASGASDVMYLSHARYYLDLVRSSSDQLRGAGRAEALRVLETENNNLRAALQWAIDQQEVLLACQLASMLWQFWYFQSHLSEGMRWIERVLNLAGPVPTDERAHVFTSASILAMELGQPERAIAYSHEALALFRASADRVGVSRTLNNLGLLALEQRDYDAARGYLEESLAIKREQGDARGIATSLINLGGAAVSSGDGPAARSYLEEGLGLARGLNDYTLIVTALNIMGWMALSYGEAKRVDMAAAAFREGVALCQRLGGHHDLADLIEGMAGVGAALSLPLQAARLLGAAEALRERTGRAHSPNDLVHYGRVVTVARSLAEPGSLEAAWQEGRGMDAQAAIAYALAEIPLERVPGG